MPYINKEEKYKNSLGKLSDCGHLNYSFSETIKEYIKQNDLNYQTFNDIVGAMECCKMELYRRLVSPYEDEKIAENGDVSLFEDNLDLKTKSKY